MCLVWSASSSMLWLSDFSWRGFNIWNRVWSADMGFEVVVACLKTLFLHLTADSEGNNESTYQDRTHCRLTPSVFQPSTCRMQGVATPCLFRALSSCAWSCVCVQGTFKFIVFLTYIEVRWFLFVSNRSQLCSALGVEVIYWDDVTLLLSKMELSPPPPNCSIIFSLPDGKWYCWNC